MVCCNTSTPGGEESDMNRPSFIDNRDGNTLARALGACAGRARTTDRGAK